MLCDTCTNSKWDYNSIENSIVKEYYIMDCRKHRRLNEEQFLKLLASSVENCSFYNISKLYMH